MKLPHTALSLLAGLLPTLALAHETWLLPEDFSPQRSASTTLQMSSGMAFPSLQAGIDPTRIVEAVLLQDGERTSLVPAGMREDVLELVGNLQADEGCAWVWLAPRVLEIDEEGVDHYLDEIGAGEDIWKSWEQQAQPRQWRESYRKLARSYLRTPAADTVSDCWSVASEARFDILPLANPNAVRRGDTMEFEVLLDGQPLAGQSVGVMHSGRKSALVRSDGDGRVAFEFDQAGPTMVFSTNLRPEPGDDFNWSSDFVTLTIDVQPH